MRLLGYACLVGSIHYVFPFVFASYPDHIRISVSEPTWHGLTGDQDALFIPAAAIALGKDLIY
jgi:hypothetical protein